VNTGDSLQWIALAAALLLVSAGLFVWRRRGSMTPESDEPAEAVFEPATSEALPAPREAPPPVVQPPVAPIPAAHTSAAEPAPLEIRLEAQSLTCSLVFANLAYRLMLTNRAGHTSGPLRIAGDMIAAHASLSADDQLSPDGEAMPKLHRVEALAPGESVTVSGQLRMAMTDIAPIRQGQAALFIPLARFDIVGEAGDKAPVTRIFVVGEANEVANGPLKPFRLDRMPGTVRGLDQRDISPLG
jgi:LPXTG-motif cell wall-anchored protein